MNTLKTVTSLECDKRHGRLWKVIGTILTLVGLLSVVVGWSWVNVGEAHNLAEDALKETIKVQTALPYIREGIRDIKTEQRAQRQILVEIKRNGGGK